MLTLLSEIHFWSMIDDVYIKDTDYGTFKYNDRKDDNSSDNLQSKKEYSEKRKYCWIPPNKRPYRLKDKLKELEEQINQNKVVYYKWVGNGILQIMLCTGLIIHIYVNIHTGDLQKISFDKYLIGKLQSGCISDVLITKSHLLCSYNDTRITLIHFTKKIINQSENVSVKLSRLEPRLAVNDLAGPTGRRLERHISSSTGGDRILVWWRCTRDDVYPWSPLVKDQDRANIHIYSLYGLKLELLCYRRTEFDLLNVLFDIRQANLIHCVEQKISRRGAVSVEVSTYEIVRNRLQQQTLTSIPLQTHVCCHALSPDCQKLVLGCIDGSVVLFDRPRGVTCVVKAAFIPTLVSWHPDGAVLVVANERSQMQWFDLSLSCIKSQTIGEDLTPANILDLSSYFKQQPTLLHMSWMNTRSGSDGLLLLIFERGPFALLRLIDGGILNPDTLVAMYVHGGYMELALGTLQALDWEHSGAACLAALQHVVSHLFRMRLTPIIEQQLQRALAIFYAPLRTLSINARAEFGDQVADMTRRFFHMLIRYRLYEKAFCLAIDIGDHDLFMDLYQCARRIPDTDMAVAALTRANELLERANSDSDETHSLCSQSECSQCSDSDSVTEEPQTTMSRLSDSWSASDPAFLPPLPTVSALLPSPPPLPQRPRIAIQPKPVPSIRDNVTDELLSSLTPLVQSNINEIKTKTFLDRQTRFRPPIQEKRIDCDSFSRNYFLNNLTYPKLCAAPASASTVHVHRTVSMNIPPAPTFVNASVPVKVNVPLNTIPTNTTNTDTITASKSSGEKNVKFSDTVTAFIVPEIPRNEKLNHLKNKRVNNQNRYLTDPKQELADSLPLCHPNDDYLKDFTPISNHSEDEDTGTKIKVVHFGMV